MFELRYIRRAFHWWYIIYTYNLCEYGRIHRGPSTIVYSKATPYLLVPVQYTAEVFVAHALCGNTIKERQKNIFELGREEKYVGEVFGTTSHKD